MARMRIDQLYRKLNQLCYKSEAFINTIGCSVNCINYIRKCVRVGALVPDVKEVERMYKDVEGVMKGDVILPQMYYTIYQDKLPDPTN